MLNEWIRDHGALTNGRGNLNLKEALHSNQLLLPVLLVLPINFLSVGILHASSKLDGDFFFFFSLFTLERQGKIVSVCSLN